MSSIVASTSARAHFTGIPCRFEPAASMTSSNQSEAVYYLVSANNGQKWYRMGIAYNGKRIQCDPALNSNIPASSRTRELTLRACRFMNKQPACAWVDFQFRGTKYRVSKVQIPFAPV